MSSDRNGIIMPEEVPATRSALNLESMSVTIKAAISSLLPILHVLFGIELVSDQVDRVIDAVFLLISTGVMIYGYIRSKRALQAQVYTFGGNIGSTANFANRSR